MKKTTKTALMAAAFAAAATGIAIAGALGAKKYYDNASTAAYNIQTHYGAPIESVAPGTIENYFK